MKKIIYSIFIGFFLYSASYAETIEGTIKELPYIYFPQNELIGTSGSPVFDNKGELFQPDSLTYPTNPAPEYSQALESSISEYRQAVQRLSKTVLDSGFIGKDEGGFLGFGKKPYTVETLTELFLSGGGTLYLQEISELWLLMYFYQTEDQREEGILSVVTLYKFVDEADKENIKRVLKTASEEFFIAKNAFYQAIADKNIADAKYLEYLTTLENPKGL